MQHIFGLSGQEEVLAVKICQADEEVDDQECADEEKEDPFDEQSELESMAYSAYGDLE